MPNIIALSFWIAAIYSLAPSIRKNSKLFYALITLLSAGALLFSSFAPSAIINEGYAALSLWIIVMLVGIPNPLKKLSKKIRLVRTQISIAAFILSLAHFISDFVVSFDLSIATGLLSLIIMIPLFITSFEFARRKMGGKRWKKLHKWSYPAYILMMLHVMLITDNPGHLAIYSLVLFFYVFFKFKSRQAALTTVKFILLALIILNLGKTLTLGQQVSKLEKPDENLPKATISENIYKDGTYIGIADGYGPDLTVEVTVEDKAIIEISIVDHNERGESFYMPAFDTVPERIVESQSVSVDAVSGSTYSSYGIMNATSNALSDALESGNLEETPPQIENNETSEKNNGKGLHRKNKQQ